MSDPDHSEYVANAHWSAYHQALGAFLVNYATVEVYLHILLREHAQIPEKTLSALVGSPRTGDLIKLIKQVGKVTKVDESIRRENEYCFAQLSEISKMRDLLVHRKTDYQNGTGRFWIHDLWSARAPNEPQFHEVSPELLYDMISDLITIQIRLFETNRPELKGHYGEASVRAFSEPWRYKPSQPKTQDQAEAMPIRL